MQAGAEQIHLGAALARSADQQACAQCTLPERPHAGPLVLNAGAAGVAQVDVECLIGTYILMLHNFCTF